MKPEPSGALLKGFFESTQGWAKTYLDLVAQQRSLLSPAGTAAPGRLPDAASVTELLRDVAARHVQLWQSTMQSLGGAPAEPVVPPDPSDRRFSAAEWTRVPAYDYLRQAYLLNAELLSRLAESMPIEEGPARTRLRFLTRLFVEAMSPSNYALTNPEFVKTAVETKGESVPAGLRNMLDDLRKGSTRSGVLQALLENAAGQ